MTVIGIRDFKARLSQYIKMVQKGEKIIITDHNVIVAELKQPEITHSDTQLGELLDKLQSQGKLLKAQRESSLLSPEKHTNSGKKSIKKSDWWPIYEASKEERF